MTTNSISIRRLDPDLPLPARAHPDDAGIDLYAAEPVTLKPFERASIRTGIAVAIPEGFAGLVLPRSGNAARHGLSIVNTPGLIDAGYRGEVCVLLINLDPDEPCVLKRGDRIAQLVITSTPAVSIVEVDALPESARGEGGFGSTGR